jgi:hypothetical protein
MTMELLVVAVPPLLIAFALAMEAVEDRLLHRERQARRTGDRADPPRGPHCAERAPPSGAASGPAPRLGEVRLRGTCTGRSGPRSYDDMAPLRTLRGRETAHNDQERAG